MAVGRRGHAYVLRRTQRGGTALTSTSMSCPAAVPLRPAAGGVSRLDQIALQLGVAVAVVIALCSYAVSATSSYGPTSAHTAGQL